MREEFGITFSCKQGYTGVKRGIELIRGTPDASYQYLVGYSHMHAQHNPGTVTAIETDSNNQFLYYFMALGVCVKGFKKYARTAFSVDGTSLVGEYKGVRLSAIGLDANGDLYPIAFAIVDSENDASCDWFMEKLYDSLGIEYMKNNLDLVVVSDRSEHFYKAISKRFPGACHVFCAYHIKGNIVKKFHDGDAVAAFFIVATAYTTCHFRNAMEDFLKQSPAAVAYVQEIGTFKWARVEAKSACFTFMTTNISESWNSKSW
ncbi:hypothetical protein MKX01_028570 [Papaver californicum]|nr:hypothetical protein MKX01_028570 [Papaver californicum]